MNYKNVSEPSVTWLCWTELLRVPLTCFDTNYFVVLLVAMILKKSFQCITMFTFFLNRCGKKLHLNIRTKTSRETFCCNKLICHGNRSTNESPIYNYFSLVPKRLSKRQSNFAYNYYKTFLVHHIITSITVTFSHRSSGCYIKLVQTLTYSLRSLRSIMFVYKAIRPIYPLSGGTDFM